MIFLIELAVLLATAKVAGEFFRRLHLPALVGEILVGVILGPTVLGHVLPESIQELVYSQSTQTLDMIAWLGGFFLLLVIGFDVDIAAIWKRKRSSLTIGTVGVAIPFLMGLGAAFLLPETYLKGTDTTQWVFALFLGTAVAISAIPVIARALHDLDILKSDLGLEILSAFTVNDIIGWAAFTIVLGVATQSRFNWLTLLRVFGGTALFITFCLTLGRKLVNWAVLKINRSSMPKPGIVLTFIIILGAVCGQITEFLGIHASLGFLLAGIMVGASHHIKERSRDIISQMVHAVFVPLFFVNIGIQFDFSQHFNPLLVGLVCAIAIGGKFLGAWLGARMSAIPRQDSLSIGLAHIPGGAMEIIVGYLALDTGLINQQVFVAILVAAVLSSLLVGPLFTFSLRLRRGFDPVSFLVDNAVLSNMKARTPREAIAELCQSVSRLPEIPCSGKFCASAVTTREGIMGTGMEHGIAIPHARIPGLSRAFFTFGKSNTGIEWNTADGLPVKLVFLILTPDPDKEDDQVKILAAIARALSEEEIREQMLSVEKSDEILSLFKSALRRKLHHFKARVETQG